MDTKMQNKPTLADPKEYALIKEIYFKENRPLSEELEPEERLERIEAKHRQSTRSSR